MDAIPRLHPVPTLPNGLTSPLAESESKSPYGFDRTPLTPGTSPKAATQNFVEAPFGGIYELGSPNPNHFLANNSFFSAPPPTQQGEIREEFEPEHEESFLEPLQTIKNHIKKEITKLNLLQDEVKIVKNSSLQLHEALYNSVDKEEFLDALTKCYVKLFTDLFLYNTIERLLAREFKSPDMINAFTRKIMMAILCVDIHRDNIGKDKHRGRSKPTKTFQKVQQELQNENEILEESDIATYNFEMPRIYELKKLPIIIAKNNEKVPIANIENQIRKVRLKISKKIMDSNNLLEIFHEGNLLKIITHEEYLHIGFCTQDKSPQGYGIRIYHTDQRAVVGEFSSQRWSIFQQDYLIEKGYIYYKNTNARKFYGKIDLLGRPYGSGTIRFESGEIYQGAVDKDGLGSGIGILKTMTRNCFEGQFVRNILHGNGAITYHNGDVYTGNFQHGMRHGLGTLVYANKNRYEGNFINDQPCGLGKLTYANGEIFEGNFQFGHPSGTGTKTDIDGTQITAEFDRLSCTGLGEETKKNGDHYNGYFSHNRKQGQGTLTTRKYQYTGNFYDNEFHGIGVMHFTNGFVYSGAWQYGFQEGYGTLTAPNSDSYTGYFRQGLFEGKGTIHFHNGDKFEGVFSEGKISGKDCRMIFANGDCYLGNIFALNTKKQLLPYLIAPKKTVKKNHPLFHWMGVLE